MNILVFDPIEGRLRTTTGTLGKRYTTVSVSDTKDLMNLFPAYQVMILDETVGFQIVEHIQRQNPSACILIAMESKKLSDVRVWLNEYKVTGCVRLPIELFEVEPLLSHYLVDDASQQVAASAEPVANQQPTERTAVNTPIQASNQSQATQQVQPYYAQQQPHQTYVPAQQQYQQSSHEPYQQQHHQQHQYQQQHHQQQVVQESQRVKPTLLPNQQESARNVPQPVHMNHPGFGSESASYRVAAPTRQEMVSVTSSRGGVGKSTVTYNLAALAARSGIRTVIVDCDPKGNIALISGTEVSRTADSWVGIDEKDASEMMVTQLLSPMACGAFLLASGTQDTVNGISEVTMTKILAMLKRYFQLILIDCEPGFSESQIVAYEQSNKILIVSPDDITTYKRTIEMAKNLRSLDLDPNKIHLVMNCVKNGKNQIRRLESLTECASIGAIPYTAEVDKVKESGEAVATKMPKLEFSKESNKVLSHIIKIDTVTGDSKLTGGDKRGFVDWFLGKKKKKAGDSA